MRCHERGEPWPDDLVEGERIIQGIPQEMLDRLIALGGASDRGRGYIHLNPEALKQLAMIVDRRESRASVPPVFLCKERRCL